MLLPLLALAPLVLGSPLQGRQAASNTSTTAIVTPTASSASGVSAPAPTATFYPEYDPVYVEGIAQPQFGQNVYLGIPFAAPPVGDLRFAPPQPASYNYTYAAIKQPAACLQAGNSSSTTYGMSEDCLYLDIFQPANASDSNPTLPVMVWVYGGSFTSGAASIYNGTAIVAQSIQTEKPVIFVAFNYRLGILGFGNGEEIAANGAANLGIRDAIQALTWIQGNIWAWGGDASKVTLAGESAGAIITSLLFLNPSQNLFRSAIMESGAQSTAPLGPTSDIWQQPYDLIVNSTGCANSTDSFQCLKQLPADELLQAQMGVQMTMLYSGAFVFCPSVDGDLIPDSPFELLENGQFAKLPYISGNNEDEGTLFVPTTVNDSTLYLVQDLIEPHGLSANVSAQVAALYPDAASGSPFGTGNETFGLSPAFKRAAAVLGDAGFQALRRHFLQTSMQYGNDQVWTYLFTSHGIEPAYLGATHSVELAYVFGSARTAAGYTDADVVLSHQMIDYWLNFVNSGADPNGPVDLFNTTFWPSYGTNLTMLQLNSTNTTLITDTYRQEQINYFLGQPMTFNYKRDLRVV